MPNNYKVDFVFEAQNGGWTESFYTTREDAQTALAEAYSIAWRRVACLAGGALLLEIRASDTAILGDSTVDTRSLGLETSGLPGDSIQNGALVRLEGGALHRRGYIMRGWPDEWIAINTAGANMLLTQAGKQALAKWTEVIAGTSGYQLRVKTRRGETPPVGVVSPEAKVIGIDSVGDDGTSTLITLQGTTVGPTRGQTIYFAGCRKTAAALNGAWPVISGVAGPDVTYLVTIPLVWGRISYAITRDYMKAVGYIPTIYYPVITKALYERITIKKTGRPFDVPHGRARPRAR